MVRIALVDDQTLVREGLRALVAATPDFEVVWEADDGPTALEQLRRDPPDVLLLDLLLPRLNGFGVMARLRDEESRVRVLVVSGRTDVAAVAQAFREGAAGFLTKGSGKAELTEAIRAVADGRRFLSPTLSGAFMEDFITGRPRPRGPGDVLTPRQLQVLQLLAEGYSTTEVARELQISVKTVETHRSNIMERLDIHDLAGLVRYAVRHRIISARE